MTVRSATAQVTIGPPLPAEPVTEFPLSGGIPSGGVFVRATSAYAVVQAGGDLVLHGVNVPRFAYKNAVLGLLVEPAWLNREPDPEDFTAWGVQQMLGDASVNANAAVAPNGAATADRLNFLDVASSNVGVSHAEVGLVNGTLLMAAVFVQEDANPDDVRSINPNAVVGFVDVLATASWQRLRRIDVVTGTVSGIYLRRVTGLLGSVFLFGAVRYFNQNGHLYEYHPTGIAGDHMKLSTTGMDPAEGTVSQTWIPQFNAVDEQTYADSLILDVAGVNFKLVWAGADTPAYIALYNAGAITAQIFPRHNAGDEIRIRVLYGGSATRPHLLVNGWGIKATAPWTPPALPAFLHVACDSAGLAQNWCQVQAVSTSPVRHAYPRRIAALGDSISSETPNGENRWGREAGSRVEGSAYFLMVGVNNNTLAQMAARVQADVVDQDMTDCVVFGGVNDLVLGRTLLQMQTDAQTIYNRLFIAGIRIVACTILPFKGNAGWNAGNEAIRVAFNTWLLLSGQAQHVAVVVDTATAMADPSDSELLNPLYDSGDFTHPNAVGAAALGDTIADGAFSDIAS